MIRWIRHQVGHVIYCGDNISHARHIWGIPGLSSRLSHCYVCNFYVSVLRENNQCWSNSNRGAYTEYRHVSEPVIVILLISSPLLLLYLAEPTFPERPTESAPNSSAQQESDSADDSSFSRSEEHTSEL